MTLFLVRSFQVAVLNFKINFYVQHGGSANKIWLREGFRIEKKVEKHCTRPWLLANNKKLSKYWVFSIYPHFHNEIHCCFSHLFPFWMSTETADEIFQLFDCLLRSPLKQIELHLIKSNKKHSLINLFHC